MDPSYDPQFFQEYMSGQATEMRHWISLMAQVFTILVGGIVLWRVSGVFGRRNKTRRQSLFEESKFNSWKTKR